ncbi:hypothetical protein Tco_0733590 [Tanacetum coccineum]
MGTPTQVCVRSCPNISAPVGRPFRCEGERVYGLVEVEGVEDLRKVDDLNGQGNDQGMGANEGVEGVNGNVEEANGGAPFKRMLGMFLTRWIKKMENVQDMSDCSVNQKVKYIAGSFMEFCPSHEMQKLETELWNHVMVGADHAAYTDRFHELASLVPHLVTPESRMILYISLDLMTNLLGTPLPETMSRIVSPNPVALSHLRCNV